MTASMQVKGLDPLLRQLKQLETRDARKALRKATRKGANVIRKDARARANRRTGGYRKSLRVKALKLRDGEVAAYKVGPSKGGKHGVLIEQGTTDRVQKATGRSTGRMPAYHVLEQANDAKRSEAEKIFRQEVQVAVNKVRGG